MEWLLFKSNQKNPESEKYYKKLSDKNKKVLNSWLNEKEITSKGKKRAGNRRRAIIKFLTFVKKDYDKITYQDYVNVASSISKSKTGVYQKNEDRYFISRFLRDHFQEADKMFKSFQLFKADIKPEKDKIQPRDLLTDLEIDKLINATSDIKKKTLIAVLSCSAGRPEEILKLKYSDIDFSKRLVYLYSAKTKRKRTVPIDPAIKHLERLKKETESSDDDLIFPSPSGKIMSVSGLNLLLQSLGKKAGIKKKIQAYLFRHTRLSHLITKLSPKVYEEISGHSLQMGMKCYAHLSQDKIIKEMREKVFEIEELTENDKEEYEKRIMDLEEKMKRLDKIIGSHYETTQKYGFEIIASPEAYDKNKKLFSEFVKKLDQAMKK